MSHEAMDLARRDKHGNILDVSTILRRYAEIEARPSMFADPERYAAWTRRADAWASTLVEASETGSLHAGADGYLYGHCSMCGWMTEPAPHWTDPREITTAVDMHHYHAHEVAGR